ncbi:MAG: hypothetical protein ACREBI_00745 [Nitrosotalea sp.]
MSKIQVHSTSKTVTTATVLMLDAIAVAALLQLHLVPLILTIPLFLIPVSVYTTVIGFKNVKERNMTQDYSYYFTWASIMMIVGIVWIVIDEKLGVIIGIISTLAVALCYVYLNRAKSIMVRTTHLASSKPTRE